MECERVGEQRKNFLVKHILLKFKPVIVIFLEMEKVEVDRFLSMKFYGARGKKWETIPPWVTAGDIFIGWNFNVLEMVQLEKGQYSVSIKFRSMLMVML